MSTISFGGDGGKHNKDLKSSAARIMEGQTWKKQRVIMLIPAAKMMSTKVALSHRALIFPPNQGMHVMGVIGEEVGVAFSNAIEEILTHPDLSKWEYILTIEHDNVPPNDGLLKLIKRMEEHPEYACIGGLYWTKGDTGVPQIWGDKKDPIMNFRPQPPVPGELVECWGTGMGFNLWRVSMFKDEKLRKPFFKTQAGKEGVGTQDLYFWGDAQKYGYRCAIDCDVLVGHYDVENDILY
jgi:hypothetical protein